MSGSPRFTVFLSLIACLVLTIGCSTEEHFTSKIARKNVSPDLKTLSLTKEQQKNVHARSMDVNLRQFNEDADTLLLIDRPSMLTRMPVP